MFLRKIHWNEDIKTDIEEPTLSPNPVLAQNLDSFLRLKLEFYLCIGVTSQEEHKRIGNHHRLEEPWHEIRLRIKYFLDNDGQRNHQSL